MKADIANIKITKLIGVVPRQISYFDDEITNYSHDQDSSLKLKKLMGYNQHRLAQSHTALSDMAQSGFDELLKSDFDLKSVDALIVVTQTPDFQIPSTSAVLHGKFGLDKNCYCIDINDGCTGFIKGLYEASSLIKCTDARRVLLVTGDVLSHKVSKNDRNSFPLVGDAVTLCVIDYNENYEGLSYPLELYFDGKGALALNIPAGGGRLHSSDETRVLLKDEEGNIRSQEHLVMQGRDVFTFTQTTVINFLLDFRDRYCDVNPSRYYCHQANFFILDRIRKALGAEVSEFPTDVISLYGNSSSATIPMSIITSFEKSKETLYNNNVMLAGFGVGLSWGAALLRLDCIEYCKLIEGDY